ncbi:MAG: nucleotidyltransferase domain-containing protein, partial [Acetatifactor sp.]|nr:nucleotidyltransferase domain-containing protein [Acetatifactor sp.]
MFEIEEYIESLITELKACFGAGFLYLGLQGSYLRGEATENSDIDIMVILENMTVTDLDNYQ